LPSNSCLPLNLVVSKFIYGTLLWTLYSSILCTCSNQHNLFNVTVSVRVGFLKQCHTFLYDLISSNFHFHCHIPGREFFYTLSFKKCSIISIFVSIEVSDAYVNVLSIIVFFSINFSCLDMKTLIDKGGYACCWYVC
jgi:hypothetical protein